MKFLCPPGIGDSTWALHKVQAIAKEQRAESIEIFMNGYWNEIDSRAVPFVTLFDFVDSVSMVAINIIRQPPLEDGCWRYLHDGPGYGFDYVLMPNNHLERGGRIEDWLPQYDVNWNLMDHLVLGDEAEQTAGQIANTHSPFVVFYPGPEEGNTSHGHNRGGLWQPEDWSLLGLRMQQLGLNVIAVGAPYDRSYYEKYLLPELISRDQHWHDYIGHWPIPTTLAVLKKAKCVISYQSGIGIVSTYLGVPTAIWWRPKGDSCAMDRYISFEESMAHCWVPRPWIGTQYLPLIYGRCTPNSIAEHAKTHWLTTEIPATMNATTEVCDAKPL